jgi:adenylate cyclase
MAQSRQLAAIMFTDIVGYTALMGNDEQRAFELLSQNRLIHRPAIRQYNGTLIKELGDGILASFSTVSDAIFCAGAIHAGCNGTADLKLRIGIHLGEVVFENNDVFGDGVNIASRLQSLAPVGGIWVSEAVYGMISNKRNVETKFVREETLKNVKDPVRIYEVTVQHIASSETREAPPEQPAVHKVSTKTIAVLPFVDMSATQDQEYLGDGLAEEILNAISHLKELKVAARTSSFQFKGVKIDLRELGEKLGVNTVLEGSVRKHGNRVRVTAQLINVKDGFHLWSEKFDRDMDDIFAIQDEIAIAITEQLKITLLEKDREKITKTATQNAEAFELYLKGRFYINRRGSYILTGLEFFKQAIAIDSMYALAYSGYAESCHLSAAYGFRSAKEIMPEAKRASEMAIELDESLGEAYVPLGSYYAYFERDWPESKKSFIRAIELNPKYAQARSLYGLIYHCFVAGDFEEAKKQTLASVKLEPLSPIDHADLGWILYSANKFEEGLSYAKTGVSIDINSFLSQRVAGLCYMALNRHEEAINTFRYLVQISSRHQHAMAGLIWAYCNAADFEQAGGLMNELEERSLTENIGHAYLGLSAAWLGDLDTAIEYLEKANEDLDPMVIPLKYSPYVPGPLRNDPRFQNLIEKVGYPL